MAEYFRTFLAIPLHEGVNRQLHRWLAPHAAGLKLRLVPPENRHLTLAFLGETPVEEIAPIAQALEEALADTAVEELTLGGLGVFPHSGVPRVLWAGFETGPWLAVFHRTVWDVLTRFGFVREKGIFVPYCTLSRPKAAAEEGVRALVAASSGLRFGSWVPDRLLFYASVPDPGGVLYSVLATIPL